MLHILQYTLQDRVRAHFIMETKNDILLDVNQHRLLMCCRMAKALGKGEVYLNASSHKMYWFMEKDDRITGMFHSIDEMEEYLEHLLENRSRIGLTREVDRRLSVIKERREHRTNGHAMLFPSRANRM